LASFILQDPWFIFVLLLLNEKMNVNAKEKWDRKHKKSQELQRIRYG
jgi:hypothetical protein